MTPSFCISPRLRQPLFWPSIGLFMALAGCRLEAVPPVDELATLATFQLPPGFKIELVAAEPMVADPVAMEIDENGLMYVVEMHGYPLDKGGSGKIKVLTDTDGDGKLDMSTLFAEGLMLPTGIMRWKQGVLVTDPPHVLYLEDTNGDHRADVKRTVLTGFAVSNPQHNLNTPILGLDNWIYLAHESAVQAKVYPEEFGDLGSEIIFPARPESPRLPQNANGRSVRFRPDQHQLEALSSDTQFGHTFDTWGNYLVTGNANHISQEILAAPYFDRNPALPISYATQSISDHGKAAEVFPITKNPEHQLLTDVGVITSACGITAYLGGAFPTGYDSSIVFVAEPVSNLVHVDRIQEEGAILSASRVVPKREFLASTDAWFRPVNMYVGPDGALYVVDYYRQIIEHPEWMAEEVIQSGQLYNGTDQGRIYRISATNAGPVDWMHELRLGESATSALVETLAHPTHWWRRNAQRLLLDRQDEQAVPALVEMAKNAGEPLGRLHALWTLQGLEQLTPDLIEEALQDPVAGIRRNAIKLAELHRITTPSLAKALLPLADDPDAQVRFQLLCTLGFVDTPEAAEVRRQLLLADVEDEWVQIAALSAPPAQSDDLLEAVLAEFKPEVPAYASLVERLSQLVAASQPPARVNQLLERATTMTSAPEAPWQAPMLRGLAQGLKRNRTARLANTGQDTQHRLIQACFSHPSIPVREASVQVLQTVGLQEGTQAQTALQQAQRRVANRELPEEERVQSLNFLALRNPAPYTDFLEALVTPREPLPVQLAALHTLDAIPDQTVVDYVLTQWATLTPEIRDQALDMFLSGENRIRRLLEAIERGTIQPEAIGWRRSVRLMNQEDETYRRWARTLLAAPEDRQGIVEEYQPALELAGVAERGKQLFGQQCAVCHRKGDQGVDFGPALASIRNRPPASIMHDILDPARSIADGYDLWQVTLKNGEMQQGVIASETPSALSLRPAGGQEIVIARQDVESLQALNTSAMPAGWEKQLDQQQMADLLAYLRHVD